MSAVLRIDDEVTEGRHIELSFVPFQHDKLILRVFEPPNDYMRIHWVISCDDVMAMGRFAQAQLEAQRP